MPHAQVEPKETEVLAALPVEHETDKIQCKDEIDLDQIYETSGDQEDGADVDLPKNGS